MHTVKKLGILVVLLKTNMNKESNTSTVPTQEPSLKEQLKSGLRAVTIIATSLLGVYGADKYIPHQSQPTQTQELTPKQQVLAGLSEFAPETAHFLEKQKIQYDISSEDLHKFDYAENAHNAAEALRNFPGAKESMLNMNKRIITLRDTDKDGIPNANINIDAIKELQIKDMLTFFGAYTQVADMSQLANKNQELGLSEIDKQAIIAVASRFGGDYKSLTQDIVNGTATDSQIHDIPNYVLNLQSAFRLLDDTK